MSQNNLENFSIIDWDLWQKMQKPTEIKTDYDFNKKGFVNSLEAKKISLESVKDLKLYMSEIIRRAEDGKFNAKFTEMDTKLIQTLEDLGFKVSWSNLKGGYWEVSW